MIQFYNEYFDQENNGSNVEKFFNKVLENYIIKGKEEVNVIALKRIYLLLKLSLAPLVLILEKYLLN